MAINYTPTNWDTTTPLNPTNFNHFEQGIKSACDGVDALTPSTQTVTSDKFVQTSFTIQKYGKMRILHFANQLKAGSYTSSDVLIDLPETVLSAQHAYVSLGGGMVVTVSGKTVRPNNAITISSNTYMIGQLVYMVA